MQGGFEAAGDLATGTLIGHTLDGHGAHAGAHPVPHGDCRNCGTALQGEFCHACGQTAHLHRTLWSIVHDVLHGVYHFEGKVWTTLPLLFWKPGSLTRRFIAGERVKFVSPLALFLFSVFLMVATFESIGGPFGGTESKINAISDQAKRPLAELEKDFAAKTAERDRLRSQVKALEAEAARVEASGGDERPVEARAEALEKRIDALDQDIVGLDTARSLVGGKKDFEEGLSDALKADKVNIHTGNATLDQRLKKAAGNPKLFLYKLQSSAYKYSWMLIPISLPFIWLLFAFRRDVGPYDHAIFAIYSLSAMTLGIVGLSVLRAIGVPGGAITTVFVLGPPLHIYKQLRGAYRIGRFGAAWRTVALLFSALLASIAFFILILNVSA